jgi:hypothetical protein
MMMLLSVRERFQTVHRRLLPDLVAPQRVAVANALAAVDRDRRAAAQRALGERLGDFDSVVALLGGDVVPAAVPQPRASSARTASMVSASAGVLSGR